MTALGAGVSISKTSNGMPYQLKIDPLDMRSINYAGTDPETGKPFSSKALRECYAIGAEKFGWKNRNSEPRSMCDGDLLVGWE
jgi:xanthine dehydrogenase YagR molybdenum-binding subunit